MHHSLSFHGFFDGHAASTFGIEGETENRHGGLDFVVAWNGGRDGQAEELQLRIQDGTPVAIGGNATTSKGTQPLRAAFKAAFARQATQSAFSGTSWTITPRVNATVATAQGTTEDDLVFVNGVFVGTAAHV
mmetsp:Transcript_24052/g.44678  ORF Transcript_24052/g.44678 Transcript_24052/m.44678 type:complete len:132 (-) Transcript_24052:23-418(-)